MQSRRDAFPYRGDQHDKVLDFVMPQHLSASPPLGLRVTGRGSNFLALDRTGQETAHEEALQQEEDRQRQGH
jgi:hypothetical protein